MKSIILLTLIFFIHCQFIFPQNVGDSTKVIKFSERIPAELILVANIKYVGAIGYADCFSGKVLKVSKGTLTDTSVLITVIAGDSYLNSFKDVKETDNLKLYFVFNQSGEKYSTTYITGFVDSDRNSWRIIGLEKLK